MLKNEFSILARILFGVITKSKVWLEVKELKVVKNSFFKQAVSQGITTYKKSNKTGKKENKRVGVKKKTVRHFGFASCPQPYY